MHHLWDHFSRSASQTRLSKLSGLHTVNVDYEGERGIPGCVLGQVEI